MKTEERKKWLVKKQKNYLIWKTFSHFSYLMLRKRFMIKLLFELYKHIFSPQFKKLKNQLYH